MARQRPRDKWRDIVLAVIAIGLAVGDQLTKSWIRSHLAVGETLFDAGVFRIVHIQNTGAAFGIFKGFPYVFIAIEVIAALAILYLFIFMRSRWAFMDLWTVRIGAGLVSAGIIGNFIDRVFFSGNVTDFIDFKWWPVFNIADMSAVCGSILLAIAVVFQLRPVLEK
jgi:signal peptidase II